MLKMVGDGEATNDRNSDEMRGPPLAGLISVVTIKRTADDGMGDHSRGENGTEVRSNPGGEGRKQGPK